MNWDMIERVMWVDVEYTILVDIICLIKVENNKCRIDFLFMCIVSQIIVK